MPQAVLTGRVLDEAGEPVRRANVSLYRQDQSLGVGLISRFRADRTDDCGTYEFANLPAGNYFVSVNARPWYALSARSIANGDGTVTTPETPPSFDVTYATTYYPDTTQSGEASPIPLRGGERLTADIHLSPVPALRILVRTQPDAQRGLGPPMLIKKEFDSTRNVTNQLMTSVADPSEGRPQNFSMLGPGLMELSGIPPGKYTVMMRDYGPVPMAGAMTENLPHNSKFLDTATESGWNSGATVVGQLGCGMDLFGRRPGLLVFVRCAVGMCWPQAIPTTSARNVAPTQDTVVGTTVRSTTRAVVLDVVVTDENGRAVDGLTKSDFTLKKDGQEQRINTFESRGTSAAASESREAPAETAGSARHKPQYHVGLPSALRASPVHSVPVGVRCG